MKIKYSIEQNEMERPIDFANAIIDLIIGNPINDEMEEFNKRELSEIVEHLQVFLKYNSGGVKR